MVAPITILMPSFNPGRYLREALLSVINQSFTDWKLILVDDGSTDSSLTHVHTLLEDPRIQVIVQKTNQGQTKALNLGLQAVESPYLVQLDSDDLFLPKTLETLLRNANRQPDDVAVLYGNFLVWHEDKNGRLIEITRQRGPGFKDRYDFLLKNCTLRPRFYRTKCVHAVGGWPTGGPFDDRFTEDRRMLLRLLDNYRFFWVKQDLYIHRKHAHNLSNDVKKCEAMREWVIRDALKRWDDDLKPIFGQNSSGRLRLKKLKKRTKR